MSRQRAKNSPMPLGPPPSHPQEHYPEHRKFLLRSLDRNDTDLAALIQLNRSIQKVKASILAECGETVLLDLGQGLLKLSPQEDALEAAAAGAGAIINIPEEGQDLCVDFLLRMKLRRKLLNRLARRLNRVAHAMDGEDVAPPPPPKYGDLRLHIDGNAVDVYVQHWQRQAEAQQRIAMLRYKNIIKSEWTAEEEAAHQRKYMSDEDHEEELKSATKRKSNTKENTSDIMTPMDSIKEEEEAADVDVKEEKDQSDEESGDDAPDNKIKDDKTLETDQATPEATNPDTTKSKPDVAESLGDQADEADYLLEEDYEVLKEYTEAYHRIYDPATGTYKYTILEQEHEEDYTAIKYGAGIGATHRSLSAKEKEMEAKRWQAAILNRIPEQPTFEALGMENRVFELEERRKRVIEAENLSKKKQKTDDSDDDESDEEEGNVLSTPIKSKSDSKNDDKKSPNKQDAAGNKTKEPAATKRFKAMSLAAVPSFYEQDLQRIRMVHADLMENSIHDHARSRLTEATNDYNAAFRLSNELYDRRSILQSQLNTIIVESRARLSKLKNDFALQVAIERSRWQKRKDQFDAQRMQALMPTRMGRHPVGTPYVSSFARSCRDRNDMFVAECMGDIIDSVVTIRENNLKGFDEFIPPPTPDLANMVEDQNTGETFAQRQARIEQTLKKELTTITAKLQASEDERRRAWRKMLKIKAEFEAPSQRYYLGPSREKIPVDSSNYHMHAVPALRSSTAASMPQPIPLTNSTVGSYTPNRSSLPSTPQTGTSMSKYSAARVRERISADGTVAPVSEPKKTKDGLYQRPAGRTRKGMTWDPVRGIWVPVNEH